MNRPTLKTRTAAASKGSRSRISAVIGASLILAVCGCGSDFNDFWRQTGDSAGRVLVDNLLTDLVNAVADFGEQDDAPSTPDPIDDDTDDPGDAPPSGDLEPDAIAGETIFTSNNCSGCHCADATGGCALNAPALIGLAVETLADTLVGDAPHVGGKFGFSAQDLADLEAYLAGL